MGEPQFSTAPAGDPVPGSGSAPVYGTPPGDEAALREAAIQRLRRKQAFRTHLVAYVLVNLLLIAIWAAVGIGTGDWYPWFIFPLFGWGIGIGMQAWSVYGGSGLTEDKIRREMDRLRPG